MGHDRLSFLFLDDVEITEKVDGSQFVFGNLGGELHMRSKGKQQYAGAIDKMFQIAADYAQGLFDKGALALDTTYYTEYLAKPKHNTLAYERTPRNNLMLFGMSKNGVFCSHHAALAREAESLEIDVAPLMYFGPIQSIGEMFDLLTNASYLGNVRVEGVVVKNYSRDLMLGGMHLPITCGKYVSEEFKETHCKNWSRASTTRGKWEDYKLGFKTEARWQKAYQHLRDNGEILGEPKDIGPLIKEIQRDIIEEEKDNITAHLWSEFSPDLLRMATAGAPEWYKEMLAGHSIFNP